MLETSLISARTPAEFAAFAPSPEELLMRVRRSPVYANLPTIEGEPPLHIAAALEATLIDSVRSFAAQCPDPRVADCFLIEYDFRDVANFLKSKYSNIERRHVTASGLPEDGMDSHIAALAYSTNSAERRLYELERAAAEWSTEGAVTPMTIDLAVDGAFIALLPELVRPLGSELIDEWAASRQRLAIIEALTRAKLSGIEQAQLSQLLLAQVPHDPAYDAVADSSADALYRNLAEILPHEARDIDPTRGSAALQRLSARLDSILDKILEPARYVPFGPERVFSFLWRLFRENRNLRALLGGMAGQIEPELVTLSLRGMHG